MLRVISVITYTYTIFVSIHTYSHFQLTLSKLSQNYRVRFNVHLWRKKLPSLISFLKILSVAFSVDDPRVGLQCELAKPSFFSIRKWVFRLRSLSFFFFLNGNVMWLFLDDNVALFSVFFEGLSVAVLVTWRDVWVLEKANETREVMTYLFMPRNYI